jgi:hypothetical protein
MSGSIYETLTAIAEASVATDVRDVAGATALGAQGTKMAANVAKATKAAKFAGKAVPFAGAAVNAADAVSRTQQGDYAGAAIAGAGVIPMLSIPAMGIQMLRDKMRTGSYMPGEDEIKAAGEPNVVLAKFDDDTSHKYAGVPKGLTDAQLNARIKQDYPNKKLSNIVKGKF